MLYSVSRCRPANNNWCISQSSLKLACLWSAGFVDLTWSWKSGTLKHEMNHRFRAKLSLIQPEKSMITQRWPFTLWMNPGASPKKKKNQGISTLHKRFSSAPLQHRCQSQKKNGCLFICRLWNWLYRGKKTFCSFSVEHFATRFHCIFCKHMYLFTFPQPHISIRCTAAGL